MRKIKLMIAALLFVVALSPFKTNSEYQKNSFCQYIDMVENAKFEKQQKERQRIHGLNMALYKQKMAVLESAGDYTVVNSFGYMGKYQFGMKTLTHLVRRGYLKYKGVSITRSSFINDFEFQEQAMEALTLHNVDVLNNYGVFAFEGKVIGDVLITKHGLLAAAHLMGPYAVKQFIKSNGKINKKDGYGTSVKDYIKEFV